MRKLYGGIAAVVAAAGALACGSGGGEGGSAAPANAADAPVQSAAPVPTTDGTIGEGTWEVGTDVKPGKYRSIGTEDQAFAFCVWSVKKEDDIVDMGTSSEANDPQVVTLKKGQTFETDGCGVWKKR